jgi:hypothetical protein
MICHAPRPRSSTCQRARKAERPAPRLIRGKDRFGRFDQHAARREIRTGDQAQQVGIRQVGVADQRQTPFDQFIQIMGRNIRGHANRDPACAIGQQVGECRRQDHRFFQRAVIIRAEIHSILGQPLEQRLGRFGHPRFGVARGGGVVAVDIAEIPLPVDQRVADVEILRQTRHRVINRGVPVRVIVAHHVACDLGRLAEAPVWATVSVRAWHTGCGDAQVLARHGHRAARGA